MEVQIVNISTLKFADYNPRKLSDAQHQSIKTSLQEFGLVDPIIINSNPDRRNTIIGGHQRVRIWKELGNNTVPAVFVSLPLEKERELNIRLNRNLGDWDWDLLLEEFKKDELLDWGFEEIDFNAELDPEEPESTVGDDVIPDAEDPITVPGDLYQLGSHVLYCGDASMINDVEKLMGDEQADLLITDPPYNVNYEGKTKDKLKIQNDAMQNEQFLPFLTDTFSNCCTFTKDGGAAYIFHADSEGLNFRKAFVDSGFELKQCCIWVKNTMVMGRQDYHWQHEPVLYGWKKGAAHLWNSDRKQTTVWNFNRPQQNKEHPTMKPLDLLCYPILNNSKKEHLILDVFGGSGSTLIASEKLGRVCRMMEIDPVYCDVIVKRYIQFCMANKRPYSVLRNGEKCTDFDT